MKLVLVDLNNFCHKFEPMVKRGPHAPLFALHAMVESLQARYKGFEVVLCRDGYPKARHKAYSGYKDKKPTEESKARRANVEAFREVFLKQAQFFGAWSVLYKDLEADDIASTMAKYGIPSYGKPEYTVLISGDADWVQIALANPLNCQLAKHHEDTPLRAAELAELHGVMGPQGYVEQKAMQGDSSDNIHGWRGIGEKNASLLFKVMKDLGLSKLSTLHYPDARTVVIQELEKLHLESPRKRIKSLIEFVNIYTEFLDDLEHRTRLAEYKMFVDIVSLKPQHPDKFEPLLTEIIQPIDDKAVRQNIIQEYKIPRRSKID